MKCEIKMIRKQSLLLTATVTPQVNMRDLQVSRPGDRLTHYREAFSSLIANDCSGLFQTIYIAENSGHDMKEFEKILSASKSRIELLKIDPMTDGSLGRCFSEMSLIDQALKSDVIKDELNDNVLIWKLTGRYSVKNIRKIITNSYKNKDIIINMRKYPIHWADMYLFAFNEKGWRALFDEMKASKELKSMSISEETIYSIVSGFAKSGALDIRSRFPFEPHVRGIRGYDGRQYDFGSQRMKRYARQIARLLAPRLEV